MEMEKRKKNAKKEYYLPLLGVQNRSNPKNYEHPVHST